MRTLTTLMCLAAVIAWHPAASAGTAGPDQGGYALADSGEEGVEFQWFDVSAEGASIPLGDDQQSAAVDIGFPFTFYGEAFEQVRIGSNGFLSFQSNDLSGGFAGQCPLPVAGQPDLAVYGFYQDLDPSEDASGPIYFATLGDEGHRIFVAVWDGVEIFLQEDWESDPVTAQIVLFEGSNEIQVNVMESGVLGGMPVWTDNTTIGVEGPEGAAGLGLCGGTIPDEYAVRFFASDGWGLFPAEGAFTAAAGEATPFDFALHNFGAENHDMTVAVESAAGWAAEAEPPAITVSAGGEAVHFQVSVTPPGDADMGDTDTLTVTVTGPDGTRTAVLDVAAAYPSDAWQALAPLPQALRYGALVSDGENLFLIGGMFLDTTAEQWKPVATVLRWDPASNAWDDDGAADLPGPAASGRACFMDGTIYYAGGYDGPAEDDVHWSFQPSLYAYDVAADSWSKESALPVATSQAVVACEAGRVYVVNGIQDLDGDGDLVTASDEGIDGTAPRLQIYDVAGGGWSEGAVPPTGASAAAAAIIDGILVLAGGTFENPDDPTASLVTRATLLYDVDGDAWDEDGPMMSAFRSDMGAAVYEGTLCVIGGQGSEGLFDTWECYAGASWVVQVDTLHEPRSANAAAGMDGYVYTAGGDDGEVQLALATRWPTGELGGWVPPEPAPDTGGDPDVTTQPDTPGPGEEAIPGDDTTVMPGEDSTPGGDTGGGGSSGGGGCAAGSGATSALPLLLALGLAIRRRRAL